MDAELADVVFLHNHPSWTWRDLQETPEDVLASLRELDNAVKDAEWLRRG